MCGIFAYWAKEATLSMDDFDILFSEAEKRGQNGVGITIISIDGETETMKWVERYSKVKGKVLGWLIDNHCIDDIVLGICRATSETEPETTLENLQPIVDSDTYCALVHNGSVTETHRSEFPRYKFNTKIDSEMILAKYTETGNMKTTMEQLSGSFAFILFDGDRGKLFAVTAFNPLAHAYIKGYGYFIHSDDAALGKIITKITGAKRDGMRVWEAWYHHEIEGYTIIETDIDTGFQFNQTFKPNFLHPTYVKPKEEKWVCLVAASGGIDSGLTAHVLHDAGYKVHLIHFQYGQKAMDAELWAVEKLAHNLDVPFHVCNLRELYFHTIHDQGMLTSPWVPIESGGDLLKSTIAWVSGRNAIFASILMGIAEAKILYEEYTKVYISAGWAQLSEETGGYPDNSVRFTRALEEVKKYGYITGDKIEFLPVMSQLTKTEEWILGSELLFPFEITVSCDNPVMTDGGPVLCADCGSTKLSMWAAQRAGVPDPRNIVPEITEENMLKPMTNAPLIDIFNRLIIPNKTRLLRKLNL